MRSAARLYSAPSEVAKTAGSSELIPHDAPAATIRVSGCAGQCERSEAGPRHPLVHQLDVGHASKWTPAAMSSAITAAASGAAAW